MGALLVEEWIGDGPATSIIDDASVALVRGEVRRAGRAAGLRPERIESLAVAASELARNQLAHAEGGRMRVAAIERDGVAGVEVVAADRGDGIADPSAAMRGEAPSPAGLGSGLSGAYRMADEMDFDVRQGEGTCAAARAWATPLPRREVAIVGRPCRGENVSGDNGFFAAVAGGVVVGLADGLGHGPRARDASDRAISTARRQPAASPSSVLSACEPALAHTRGTALTIVHLDEAAGAMVHAGAGNIITHLYQGATAKRLMGVARVLGVVPGGARLVEERQPLDRRYVLVMFTDGLSSRLDLQDDLPLRRQPPLVIAHTLLERHGQSHDDAMVAVVRLG